MPQAKSADAPPRKLLAHHRAALHARSLTDETIERAGICSVDTPSKLQMRVGWKLPAKCAPALVIPYIRQDGTNGYARVRPDTPRLKAGELVKYESPAGQPNEIYIPPGTHGSLENTAADLFITEGEFKALASDQLGQPCIGLVGVYGWKVGKSERLLPAFNHIALKDRNVYIVYDSDIVDKPEVRDAESRLAKLLTDRGAVVKVCRIPPGTSGADGKPTKVGLDDFLAASGAEAHKNLAKLKADATPPAEINPAEMKALASELDPASEAEAYLASGEKDGISRLRFWRGEFRLYSAGRYRAMANSEIRAHLVRHLNEAYRKLSTPIVANCIDQLRAQSLLRSTTEPPAWLDDPGVDWPPGEILVCHNGLIHLPSLLAGQASKLPPTPRLFSLSSMPFDFDPEPPAPRNWLEFLKQLWGEDAASIDVLQEWFGYSLLQDTSLQKILMLVGPKRSGKGTIARILAALIGKDNICNPTLSSLGTNFGLWPLIGKSLAIISDARLGGRSDTAAITERLLSISGEDGITIDRKMLEPWTGKLGVRFVVITNQLPRLADASGALSGRMVILRMTNSWYGHEDRRLIVKLLPELPGILKWAIVGWQRLNERGHFAEPESSESLREQMDDLSSPVGAFIRDRCRLEPPAEIVREDLYDAYREWRGEQGCTRIEEARDFGVALRAACPEIGDKQKPVSDRTSRHLGKVKRHYTGIRLKAVNDESDEGEHPDLHGATGRGPAKGPQKQREF